MQTVTLDEAQKHLAELVRELGRAGDLLITDAEKPFARLSSVASKKKKPHLLHSIANPRLSEVALGSIALAWQLVFAVRQSSANL